MSDGRACKVDRVIREYDLGESTDDQLLARWVGEDGRDGDGYRTLTDWFNQRLLRTVYDEHGRDVLGARVEHDYETLRGDDELERQEMTESLRSDGIDADRVTSDMVSWGTMRTHLQDCLGGEKDTSPSESDWERESVSMARSFAREKVDDALSSLASKGELAGVAQSSVSVQVQVQCEACPTRVPLDVAIDRGYVCEDHSDPSTDQTEASR